MPFHHREEKNPLGAKIMLITGGIRSGKSAYALKCAETFHSPKIFLATAEALDEAMNIRIQNHQKERGEDYTTIEEPLHIDEVLHTLPKNTSAVIIDCMTLWVNNLLYKLEDNEQRIQKKINVFLKVLQESPLNIFIVTNEVGLGIIPENKMARRYIDVLGRLNQDIAGMSDEVTFMVSGIPQKIKGK